MRLAFVFGLLLAASGAFAQTKVTAFGTVLDQDGKPVAGADVKISVAGTNLQQTLKTNRKGKFNAFKIKQGEITVVVSKAGYQTKEYTYDHKKVRETIKIQLMAEGKSLADVKVRPKLKGVVKDTKGKILGEVTLKFSIKGIDDYGQTITTGADGKFEVEGVANNLIEVYAKKDEYRDQIYRVRMAEKDEKIDDFKMQTLNEAYAEMGIDPSTTKKKPKDLAIDFYNEAVPFYQQKKWSAAEEMAKKSIEQDPTLENSLKLLVWANKEQNDWKEVLQYGQSYLKLKPEDKNVMNVTIYAAETVKDKTALKELKELARASGSLDPSGIFNQAVEKINAGDDAAAGPLLLEVIEIDSTFARAYFELGKMKTREFEFEEAIKYLKLYLKNAPKGDRYRKEAEDLILTLAE
ncbi:MAG: carboxypeptidase regulatory-like domain-containing protein [Acidobacteriota bacterium]|nr:carboxypeptidase regulatory-like domain-containing protein [Acidobacteriota bacterium]